MILSMTISLTLLALALIGMACARWIHPCRCGHSEWSECAAKNCPCAVFKPAEHRDHH